jgi:hypothetical protein
MEVLIVEAVFKGTEKEGNEQNVDAWHTCIKV